MKAEMAVLGSPSLIVRTICGRTATFEEEEEQQQQEQEQEQEPHASELRSCVKAEMAVLGSPSLVVLMVSVDVEQH